MQPNSISPLTLQLANQLQHLLVSLKKNQPATLNAYRDTHLFIVSKNLALSKVPKHNFLATSHHIVVFWHNEVQRTLWEVLEKKKWVDGEHLRQLSAQEVLIRSTPPPSSPLVQLADDGTTSELQDADEAPYAHYKPPLHSILSWIINVHDADELEPTHSELSDEVSELDDDFYDYRQCRCEKSCNVLEGKAYEDDPGHFIWLKKFEAVVHRDSFPPGLGWKPRF